MGNFPFFFFPLSSFFLKVYETQTPDLGIPRNYMGRLFHSCVSLNIKQKEVSPNFIRHIQMKSKCILKCQRKLLLRKNSDHNLVFVLQGAQVMRSVLTSLTWWYQLEELFYDFTINFDCMVRIYPTSILVKVPLLNFCPPSGCSLRISHRTVVGRKVRCLKDGYPYIYQLHYTSSSADTQRHLKRAVHLTLR